MGKSLTPLADSINEFNHLIKFSAKETQFIFKCFTKIILEQEFTLDDIQTAEYIIDTNNNSYVKYPTILDYIAGFNLENQELTISEIKRGLKESWKGFI
jgi:hypothetical protein